MAEKNKVAKKVYILDDGEELSRLDASKVLRVTRMEFRFTDGETVPVNPLEFPEAIQRCLLFAGTSEIGGNAYANKGDDLAAAKEALDNRIGVWVEGNWSEGRMEGVVPTAVILEAIRRAKEKHGQTFDFDATKAKLLHAESGADFRKAVLANVEIEAFRRQIMAEKAADRAAEAMKKANEKVGDAAALANI